MARMTLIAYFLVVVSCRASARADDPAVNQQTARPPAEVRLPVPPTARYMCGIDCLYVCLRALGRSDVTLADLELRLPRGSHGVSFQALMRECQAQNVQCQAIKTNLETLARYPNPAILHVQDSHYIVFLGREGDRYLVFDNAAGVVSCTREWFDQRYKWDGAALVIGPPPPALIVRMHGVSIGLVVGGGVAFVLFIYLWMKRTHHSAT